MLCFFFNLVINLNDLDTDDVSKRLTAEQIYELCTLCLYGTTAISPRIKILLDQILDTLTQAERENILKSLKWSIDDYEKSYIEHVSLLKQSELVRLFFLFLLLLRFLLHLTIPDTLYQNEHQLFFFSAVTERNQSSFSLSVSLSPLLRLTNVNSITNRWNSILRFCFALNIFCPLSTNFSTERIICQWTG